ncbi:MAG: alpha/beta hydrolase [Gemmataceae bacterium]|nr:alpha/beta hydrolase [Gemmataceae bacterium]
MKSFAWRHWRAGYVVAVAASCVFQTVRPGLPSPAPGHSVASVARQAADGPRPGPAVEVAYQDHGAGPVVVLLHGSPGAVADFRHLLPHLAGFRVLVPDLPGFGRSSRWLPDYSVAAHARYVLAWLDALGVAEFQVVGFSQGSGVALHLADLAPNRVRSVALFGGIGVQEGEGSGDYHLEHAKYAGLGAAAVVAPEFVPHFGLLGSRSFRWTFFRNFWDTDQRPLRGVLERLRPPLLVLHGRRDPLVPAWAAVEHHRLHPDGELHLFPDSHFMLFSADGTDRLAAALAPFLDRHCGPAPAPPRSRVVWYGEAGVAVTDDPPDLPARTLWPAGIQFGVPFSLGLLSPVGGCVVTGLSAGWDRIDPFAGWLGCALGGLARRLAADRRATVALARWLPLSAGLVIGSTLIAAAVWWWGSVFGLCLVSLWLLRRKNTCKRA